MYIRPQLSRKRTGDRVVLSKEHNADVIMYRQLLEVGAAYENDISKVIIMLDALVQNDSMANEDKKDIIAQLNQLLLELQKEFSSYVENELADIEFSMQERIDEIQSTTNVQESEVFRTETTIWHTGAVDKDKLIAESRGLLYKYQDLLEKSKSDLHQLKKEAEEQRQRIKEHRTKR